MPVFPCSLPTPDPWVVGMSLQALGIIVLLSLQPAAAGPAFCACASCFSPASFTKTPILPLCPGDLHRKLTLNTAKERRGRQGEEAHTKCGVWFFVSPL